uniref:Cytochrome oxidase assembly protein 1 n=1 Tax=Parastrongyloides trichosuri TaxID=131310 RepID=A0A0N4ZTE9_PARTI
MLKKVSPLTLVQLACGSFVIGSGLIWYAQRNVQKKVRNLPHYKECFTIIAEHEKVISLLGKPIQIGQVDLTDRKSNFIGKDESQLRIPISGKFNSGFLNVHAKRITCEENKDGDTVGLKAIDNSNFVTNTIELELDDKTVLIYEKNN